MGSYCLPLLEPSAWLPPTEPKRPGSLELPSGSGRGPVLARAGLWGKRGCGGLWLLFWVLEISLLLPGSSAEFLTGRGSGRRGRGMDGQNMAVPSSRR